MKKGANFFSKNLDFLRCEQCGMWSPGSLRTAGSVQPRFVRYLL